MNREKLLRLINEDEEIQDALRGVINQDKPLGSLKKDEKEIEMLKGLVEKWKKHFQEQKVQTDTLTEDLAQTKERLNQDIVKLQKAKEELISSNEKLTAKKDELIATNSQLENSVQALKSDNKTIQSSNTKLNKTIEFYRKNFEDELEAYELFSSLGSDTKDSLSGIFKDATLQGFLSCGVQDKNISSFWEYIKTELQEDKNSDTEKLIKIYDFLFQKYQRAFPIYEPQRVAVGDQFDPLSHINHSSSSAVSGTITKVLLRGYINTKNQKVMKQSVVRVG